MTNKKCGICGEIIQGGSLECPKCGSGVFESSKTYKPKPRKVSVQTYAKDSKQLEYFKDGTWSPSKGGYCSDNNCPCSPETYIPVGEGYLYVSQEVVNFRRKYRSPEAARSEMKKRHNEMAATLAQKGSSYTAFYHTGPILVCEQGARLRNLDLKVAGKDARHWWSTGKVPLRATPLQGTGISISQSEPLEKGVSEEEKKPPKQPTSWMRSIIIGLIIGIVGFVLLAKGWTTTAKIVSAILFFCIPQRPWIKLLVTAAITIILLMGLTHIAKDIGIIIPK
jgi:hypothetical protein